MEEFTKDKWVCPSDRELSLRAKLKMGWSVKTSDFNTYNKVNDQLKDGEQDIIFEIIQKAERAEKVEQERIGRLVERIENMKQNAMGNGTTNCILCSDEFGLLSSTPQPCADCNKVVCTKCGVETYGVNKEVYWMCKICAETREMWKNSGAWFFKSLPKYKMPIKKNISGKYSLKMFKGSPRTYETWSTSQDQDSFGKDSTESSDEEILKSNCKPKSFKKSMKKNSSFVDDKIAHTSTKSTGEPLPYIHSTYPHLEVETIESIKGSTSNRLQQSGNSPSTSSDKSFF